MQLTSRQRANKRYYERNREKLKRNARKRYAEKTGGAREYTLSEESEESETSEEDTPDQQPRVTPPPHTDTPPEKVPSLAFDNPHAKNICIHSGKTIGIMDECPAQHAIREYTGQGEFYHTPNSKAKRDCLYICAPNQAGKTTYVGRFLEQVREKDPKRKIYVFSKLDEDPILDRFKPRRLDAGRFKLRDNTLELLKDSVVVFDDVDQYHDKQVKKKVYSTINEILCNGAHFGITILITNHHLSDYTNTRTILNECSSITVFCKSGCTYQLDRVLKMYVGMSPDQIRRVKSLPSRWVTITKHYPTCVLYNGGAYLL